MMLVHKEGKLAVSNGIREAMERVVEALHTYGLWATCE
jgi:ATP-dependent Clp protease adaptor protein ClpS